jgi:hypothetical protein
MSTKMTKTIPNSVRYIKNGEGGKWWKTAKANESILKNQQKAYKT